MIKILVVDDESRTREGLCTLIENSGLPVEIAGTAANGKAALTIAAQTLPDIILTDVRMPRMDGIAFSTEVRKILPESKIIFISGYSDKEYLKAAIFLKAVSYLEKPIRAEELEESLKSCIHDIEEEHRRQDILLQSQSYQRQHREAVGNQLAIELLDPQTREEDIRQLYSLYPAFSGAVYYCTLICQLQFWKDREDNSLIAVNRFRAVLDNAGLPYLMAGKKSNLFIIHVGGSKLANVEAVRKAIMPLYRGFVASLSDFADVFMAVSNAVSDPKDIYQSYINAVVCLKKLFFTGYNNICFYEYTDEDMGDAYQANSRDILRFTQALKSNNVTEAEAIVNRLFHDMKKTRYKFETNSIKDVYYQLLTALDNLCRERNFTKVFPGAGDFIWDNIAQRDTIHALQEFLEEKLSLYAQAVAGKEGSHPLVYRIQQYVAEHYQDTDLSVKTMAEDLHFTPAYLCNVYKAEKNDTIISYINTYRVDKARELLKKRETKVFEVSYLVGYGTSHYFARQFKKLVGMTPTEYREKYVL